MDIRLREWELDDAFALHRLEEQQQKFKDKFFKSIYPVPFLYETGRIQFYQSANSHHFIYRAIEVDGIICGYIQCVKRTMISADLSYYLDVSYRHQGIMQMAIHKLLQQVYTQLNVISITARIHEKNIASQRVVEANGFQKETVLDMILYTKYK